MTHSIFEEQQQILKCQQETPSQTQPQLIKTPQTFSAAAQPPLITSLTTVSSQTLSPEREYSLTQWTQGGLFNNYCEEVNINDLLTESGNPFAFNINEKLADFLSDFENTTTTTTINSTSIPSTTTSTTTTTTIVSNVTTNTISSVSTISSSSSSTQSNLDWMEQTMDLSIDILGQDNDIEEFQHDVKEESYVSSPSPSPYTMSPTPTPTPSNSTSTQVVGKKRGRKPIVDAITGQPAKKVRGTPSKPKDENPHEMEKYLKLRESNNL